MLETLLQQIGVIHRERFNAAPQWLASAPGRVNLIGDHTDYTDGFALPFAIDRYTVVSASVTQGPGVVVFSTLSKTSATVSLGPPERTAGEVQWHDYVQGVLTLMHEQGFSVPGLEICVHGDLPVGSGLSSSASLELALATLVEGINDRQLGSHAKITLCQRAEHDYALVPCGILDQYSICEGQQGAGLLLDCRSQTAKNVTIAADKFGFLVVDSLVRHQHSGGGYAARREQCEEAQLELGCSLRDATRALVATLGTPLLQKRAGHVVSENSRVCEFAEVISQQDLARAGELMFASHVSLRDDFEVSCAEVDTLIEISRNTSGVLGARMTGGGFGGSVVVLVRANECEAVAASIAAEYRVATGHTTQPLVINAVGGCRLHKVDV